MNALDRLDRLRSVAATAQVFSDPYTTSDGSTVIAVSTVKPHGSVKAVGIFVVTKGDCVWTPAIDQTRIAVIGVTIGLVAATLSSLAVLRRPPWPDLSA
ncbi:MAG: hypothetical protein WBD41_24490 [Rhodococcus sp. (in: high G+C Gram-positive bacteria)]|jgi:hypothetical protein|uniref:hypothetical protein n=1 Tax=Rhodococcus sp. EPR-157 TaxID=1813677 RepID=UPI0007BC1D5F|nr:hypothetical protein [Rhodococcus sp. EPR-157]KZF10499.1 hypothetical protein A2J03_00570 [Rhodococcus sp. EPR-157]